MIRTWIIIYVMDNERFGGPHVFLCYADAERARREWRKQLALTWKEGRKFDQLWRQHLRPYRSDDISVDNMAYWQVALEKMRGNYNYMPRAKAIERRLKELQETGK